jgi:hypothetical protein
MKKISIITKNQFVIAVLISISYFFCVSIFEARKIIAFQVFEIASGDFCVYERNN